MQLMTGHIFLLWGENTNWTARMQVVRWGSCMLTFLTSLFLDPADLESSLCIERERDLSWFTKSLSDLQQQTRFRRLDTKTPVLFLRSLPDMLVCFISKALARVEKTYKPGKKFLLPTFQNVTFESSIEHSSHFNILDLMLLRVFCDYSVTFSI